MCWDNSKGLAGPAFMPPAAAFDPYFWRDDDHQLNTSQSGATNAQQEVMDDANKLKTLRLPPAESKSIARMGPTTPAEQ